MVVLTSLEERRRRSRNIVFAAFILLIIIWTYKMVHPKSTLISYYYQNSLPSTQPATSPSTPKSANPNSNPNADKWKTVAPAVETADTFNGTVTTKAAVIVETRFRTNLIPLILHFSSVLGPSWPILIYTSPEALGFFASSAALARFTSTGVIQIRLLPQTLLFTDSDSVNAFMTGPWLWEHLAPAEHILIFQSDSMLCANAARSVDDFFVYDIVGAPMKKETKGYNKGLSLRKRSTVLKVLENWEWKTTKKVGDRFEDQWFYNRMLELQESDETEGLEPTAEGAINLPTPEVARTFSVETIDYPHPLGVHSVHKWPEDQMSTLEEWCPEYKLCSEDQVAET